MKNNIINASKIPLANRDFVLELKNLTKSFDDTQALKGINLQIKEGEFVTLLGPSGCGKSTTLRMLAGFDEPDSGEILLDGKKIKNMPAYERPINTVFQDYSLFPHLNVLGNLLFPLKNNKDLVNKIKNKYKNVRKKNKELILQIKSNKKYSKDDIKNQIEKIKSNEKNVKDVFIDMALNVLEKVGLKGYENRDVHKLSGGQKQRVAIARAIINKPRVLLLDEPLGALDKKLRNKLQWELKELQVETGITFVFVTHDQEEAMVMSDRVIVLNEGLIEQVDSPVGIYEEPANIWVADFIGDSNIIIDATYVGDQLVRWDNNTFNCVDKGFDKGEKVNVVVRPEDIILSSTKKSGLKGKITSKVFKGITYEYDVICSTGREYLVQTIEKFDVGANVNVIINADEIHVMEKSL